MQEKHKQCAKCGESKLLDEFYKNKGGKYGRRGQCKNCCLKNSKEYYARPEVKEHQQGYQKEYYARPGVKEYQQKYRKGYNKEYFSQQENKELQQGRMKEYYARPEVKERIQAQQKEYRTRPGVKERISDLAKEYHKLLKSDPEYKARTNIRTVNRRARKHELSNTLTMRQWEYALDYFDGGCAVCGCEPEQTMHKDHWIPLSYKDDGNPGTVATNIVPLCEHCNFSKSATLPDKWLTWKFGERKSTQIAAKVQAYFDSLID